MELGSGGVAAGNATLVLPRLCRRQREERRTSRLRPSPAVPSLPLPLPPPDGSLKPNFIPVSVRHASSQPPLSSDPSLPLSPAGEGGCQTNTCRNN